MNSVYSLHFIFYESFYYSGTKKHTSPIVVGIVDVPAVILLAIVAFVIALFNPVTLEAAILAFAREPITIPAGTLTPLDGSDPDNLGALSVALLTFP